MVVCAIICAACIVSCNKDDPNAPNKSNPTECTLKGCDFGITLLDYEKGGASDSSYVFEGVWKEGAFRFGLHKLDEMTPNILPDGQNRLVLNVDSEEAGFEGVNAASTARCVNIIPVGKDHISYELVWVAEGESTITLWCGEGPSRKEISFKVTSRKEIPLEGFRYRINNEVFDFQAESFENRVLSAYDETNPGWENMQVLEIIGPTPLNATVPDDEFFVINENYGLPDMDDDAKVVYGDGGPEVAYGDRIYELNLRHYGSFRWLKSNTDEDFKKDVSCWNKYKPADFRERRILVWKVTSGFSGQSLGSMAMNIYRGTICDQQWEERAGKNRMSAYRFWLR